MDDHRAAWRRCRGGSALGRFAPTHQPARASRQRAQSIGTALPVGARISGTHGAGQLVQPPVQCPARRIEHFAIEPGHAGLVVDDVDMATPDRLSSPAHRITIDFRHLAIH